MKPTEINFEALFQAAPGNYLILLPDSPHFTIIGASDAYLDATKTTRSIIGKGLSEIFPDNPSDPKATGVKEITESFNRVIQLKKPDILPNLKYAIPCGDGKFEERYWSPQNSPVLDKEGNVQYIINRVMDITDLVKAQNELAERNKALEDLNSLMVGSGHK